MAARRATTSRSRIGSTIARTVRCRSRRDRTCHPRTRSRSACPRPPPPPIADRNTTRPADRPPQSSASHPSSAHLPSTSVNSPPRDGDRVDSAVREPAFDDVAVRDYSRCLRTSAIGARSVRVAGSRSLMGSRCDQRSAEGVRCPAGSVIWGALGSTHRQLAARDRRGTALRRRAGRNSEGC